MSSLICLSLLHIGADGDNNDAILLIMSLTTSLSVSFSFFYFFLCVMTKVGQMLAETLMDGTFGRRPVTLLGFSLGARVVYFCLKVLLLASSRSFNILFPYTQVEREKKNQ